MDRSYGGVDAGGSHSEIVIVDQGLRVLARVRGPAAAVRPDQIVDVVRTIAAGVSEGVAQARRKGLYGLVVAAAGAGREAERIALEAALREQRIAERVKVITDGEAALDAAFPGRSGILVISGTGSIACGRDDRGKIHRVGGWGWQMGDEGSGYDLGRAALSAAGKASDGRGPSTTLVEMIHRETGTANLDQLIRWAQTATRDQVAQLARVACDAATAGDAVARELLQHAARELAAHVTALLRRLAPGRPDGIALTGGLLRDSPVRAMLTAELQRAAPSIPVQTDTVDAALGAARLALSL